MRRLLICFLLLTTVGLMTAYADSLNGLGPAADDPPIGINAGWYGFCFGGAGSAITAGCQNSGVGVISNTITFTTAGPVDFNITDAFNAGDSFDVYVGGVLMMSTPSVPSSSCSDSDPNLAFANPCYSHGSLLLGPGSYNIDVFVRDSPFGSGGAYLEVVTADTPEPGSLALLGSGLIGLAGSIRRKLM